MQNYANALISIVVPCYNEEGNVELLYNKVKETLRDTKLEFIFVDDNSNDRTLEIIDSLSKKDESIKYISFSRNFGHQNALNILLTLKDIDTYKNSKKFRKEMYLAYTGLGQSELANKYKP